MIETNKSKLRILSLLLAVALILACLPAGALAESFSAAVKSKKMKVYGDSKGKDYLGSLGKKTIVTVLDHDDGVAKIRYNGKTGYALVSDMRRVDSFADEAEVSKAGKVYQNDGLSGKSVKIRKGTEVYVLDVDDGVAMIEKDGKVGYMKASLLDIEGQDKAESQLPEGGNGLSKDDLEDLKDALEEESKKEEEKEESNKLNMSFKQAYKSGKYSNEQLCYLFAVKELGYNNAAAAGLLANISAESGFRVTAVGDSGRSYGICQWFASRKTRLLNWCADKGADPDTLAGQLYFLKYELEKYYPSVHRYMKNVDNSAKGAYDAAYHFCYNFEAPANKASKSASRGNTAQSTYYPRYEAYTA